jgi:hypothetical protein
MTKAATMPDLQYAILQHLKSWHLNEDPPGPNYHWPGVNDDLVTTQGNLGRQAFLEGGILREWEAKQAEYYTWLKQRNAGR